MIKIQAVYKGWPDLSFSAFSQSMKLFEQRSALAKVLAKQVPDYGERRGAVIEINQGIGSSFMEDTGTGDRIGPVVPIVNEPAMGVVLSSKA